MQMSDLANAGAAPALEMTMRFAGARQRILSHNIANIDTPNFVARDVDPIGFQEMLGEAIDRRRAANGGGVGGLDWEETREIARSGDGLVLNPTAAHGGILGQDRNATDLERLMQSMVENASMYRVAGELYRRQKSTLDAAIAQRVI